jgi:hypothetical protein
MEVTLAHKVYKGVVYLVHDAFATCLRNWQIGSFRALERISTIFTKLSANLPQIMRKFSFASEKLMCSYTLHIHSKATKFSYRSALAYCVQLFMQNTVTKVRFVGQS